MKEHDTPRLSRNIRAQTIGSQNTILLPEDTVVTIVVVYGDPECPEAYEIEAYDAKTDSYHLATVLAADLK